MRRTIFPQLLFAFLLSAASLAVNAASPTTLSATLPSLCPNCISKNVCADIETHGTTACSVTVDSGCKEEMGICVCGNCEETLQATSDMQLSYDTPYGRLQLFAVDKNRFAAWDCKGRLAFLVEKTQDGRIVEVPVMRFRNTYAFRRVLENAEGARRVS